jgi:DNA replication protein DnaC
VRFTTAANLVNELVEASQHHGVRRVLARWMRYDVIALDEVGYVLLAEIGAEFLFQVIAERAGCRMLRFVKRAGFDVELLCRWNTTAIP